MAIERWFIDVEGLLTAANIAVAVSLAGAVGLAVARWIGQAAALRHAVLVAALLLVLLSPLLVGISQTARLSWFAIEVGRNELQVEGSLSDGRVIAPSARGVDGSVLRQVDVKRERARAMAESNDAPIERKMLGETNTESARTGSKSAIRAADEMAAERRAVSPIFRYRLLGTLLVLIWLLGSVVLLVRLARGYLVVFRLRRSLRRGAPVIVRLAERSASRIGLRNVPEVFESDSAPAPLIVGLWRPVIVVPCGIEREVQTRQLEGMLLHEMAHIARHDLWVGVFQRLAAVMFWWQPLVHRLNTRLSAVREDLCDNYVIREHGSGHAYAQVLVDLAARATFVGSLPATIALLEESAGLEARMCRLLDARRSCETKLSCRAMLAVGVSGIVLALLLVTTTFRVSLASNSETNGSVATNGNEIHVADRNELIRAVRTARPGTMILLEPGTYRGGLSFDRLRGTAERPIVIAAADPNSRPIIKGGSFCIQLTDPAYVELRDLVLTGARHNGLNIDDGGSYDSPAHHVVLSGLVVKDNGSDANHDGIKLSGLDDFHVENCLIERWGKKGSGIDMVGCHRGVVSGSTFREGGRVFGSGVQMKGGSAEITVRYCRFEDAGARAVNIGGSTGLPYFRPKRPGYEAKEITVEDCTFSGSMAPIAFVGVDGANVHHNTIYRPTRWAVRILQENQGGGFVACRNGRFANNIIVYRSDEMVSAVNVGAGTSPKSFLFAGNYWYCLDRPEKTRRAVRLPVEERNGVYDTDPMFIEPRQGNLKLKQNSPVRDAGARSRASDDTKQRKSRGRR